MTANSTSMMAPRQALSVAAYLTSSADTQKLADLLSQRNFDAQLHQGNSQHAMAHCREHAHTDILIVELTSKEDLLIVSEQLRSLCSVATKLIVVAPDQGIEKYRQLVAIGIFDYLPTPLNHDALIRVFKRIESGTDLISERLNGTCVWGMKGGVGTSTIAANIAWQLANTHHRHTLAVDLDVHQGDLGLHLGQESHGQLSGLLAYAQELDPLLLERSIVSVNERLALLDDDQSFTQSTMVNVAELSSLARLVNQEYAGHVWDTAKASIDKIDAVLPHCQTCVLIADLTLSGARELAKALAFIEKHEHLRAITVVNQVRPQSGRLLTLQEFEQALGIQIGHVLDHNGKAFTQAQESGEMVSKGGGKISAQLKGIALDCLGQAQPQKAGLFSFLDKRKLA